MNKFTLTVAAVVSTLAFAGAASAAIDTYEAGNAPVAITGPTGSSNANYFIPAGPSPTSFPYYRDADQDWGWQHGAIAGASTATSIKLNISNYDVDAPTCNGGSTTGCESDIIYGYDTTAAAWLQIGLLTGVNNAFSFTEFDLHADLFDDVEAGLKVWMDIDSTNNSWVVTLAKSVITTAGEDPGNPNPGSVPLPAAGWLMIAGFGGLAAMRRRKSKS